MLFYHTKVGNKDTSQHFRRVGKYCLFFTRNYLSPRLGFNAPLGIQVFLRFFSEFSLRLSSELFQKRPQDYP